MATNVLVLVFHVLLAPVKEDVKPVGYYRKNDVNSTSNLRPLPFPPPPQKKTSRNNLYNLV
jgi:hypothetical protein